MKKAILILLPCLIYISGCLCDKKHIETYPSATEEQYVQSQIAVEQNQAPAQEQQPVKTPTIASEPAQVVSIANIKDPKYKREYIPTTPPPRAETYFAFDSNGLSDASKENISLFAQSIKDKQYNITIQGHTDSIGSREYNQKLSERRAKAVKAELVKNGLDASKIEVVGYGKDRPIADNSTAEGRAQNRRTVMFAETNSN